MSDDFEILPFEYMRKGSKNGSLEWDVSPLMIEKFKYRIGVNPSFAKVFDERFDFTKYFKKELKFRTSGERNIVIELIGDTGIGKSSVALTLAVDWMSKPVVLDDICFTSDELLDRAKVVGLSNSDISTANHTLIQDEQINQLGVGSVRESLEQQTLEDTTRKFGLNIIFCSPTTRNHSTAHYCFEIICICKKLRLTKVAWFKDGFCIGYFVIRVLSDKNKLWVAYEKKKDAFIKDVLSRSTSRLSIDEKSEAVRLNPLFRFCKTKEEMKLLVVKMFPTLTTQEVSNIVTNILFLNRIKGLGGVKS